MGLLDGLISQDPTQLALASGLLSGTGNWGANLAQGITAANAQQAQVRANRQNDLQQVMGLYKIALQNDMIKQAQDDERGIQHVEDPSLGQLRQKLGDLAGFPILSGNPQGRAPMPSQAPQVPGPQMSTPQNPRFDVPPPQGQQQPQMPQQPMQPPPGSVFGIPRSQFLAYGQIPGGEAYMNARVKSLTPINVRPGGTVYQPGTGPLFYAPQYGPGMQPQVDANGNRVGAEQIPGYAPAASQVEAMKTGGAAYGRLHYEPPTAYNTPGAPTGYTPAQAIKEATGQAPLPPWQDPAFSVVTPATQTTRNADRLAILNAELQRTTNPQDRAAIQTEIGATQGAQQRGDPFSSQVPPRAGMVLQDQGASASQKELGQGLGKQGAEIYANGAASVQGKRQLQGMIDMAQNFTPGVFQPLKAKLASYATGMGMDENTVNSIMHTNQGDIQGLTSAAITMAGKLTRQTDAQPSQLQFLKILESMPKEDRTLQGFTRIMSYLNSMHDYNIERMSAYDMWRRAHQGDPDGFEVQWAKEADNQPFPWNAVTPSSARGGSNTVPQSPQKTIHFNDLPR